MATRIELSEEPTSGDTLVSGAVKVLRTGDPCLKAQRGSVLVHLWQSGKVAIAYHPLDTVDKVPDKPARDSTVRILPPGEGPKRGRGGSLSSRQAILHSLVHIESWAVDLSWDIIARFGPAYSMPREFFDDFVKVAADEGRHFQALERRLRDMGSSYGAFPAHDGLWESATETADDLLARLAVEHCVHEARGLDVVPQTIARFRSGGDKETADLLEKIIYPEEITHCAAGVKWFTYLCKRALETEPFEAGGTTMCMNSCDIGERRVPQEQGAPAESDGAAPTDVRDAGVSSVENIDQKMSADSQSVTETFAACSLDTSLVGRPSSQDTCQLQGERPDSGSGVDGRERRAKEVGEEEFKQYVVSKFHDVVRRHFRGPLKPPFNEAARAQAGFGTEWYLPLSTAHPSL